ncbi:MAG: hypothetical protein EOP54_05005 [Sphingobacteriales bacterium]|nr:MAG: hypothetical protein EOP54_05005 [Sphingobacteriales bacterium]
MRFLQIAIEEVIDTYNGALPLSHFLKSFFKSRPKLGSRDRRAISDAVYSYFRIAGFVATPKQKIWSIINWALEHRIIENVPITKIIAQLDPQVIDPDWEHRFPGIEFSGDLSKANWFKSLLTLPRMFIRIRKNDAVIENILKGNNINFQKPAAQTISLANGINLANILPETHYVIQDYSSQRSLHPYFELSESKQPQKPINVWDTCAGAGGKMLLIKDHLKESNILCTDIRPGSLHNLRERAQLYGHKQVKTRLLDASKAEQVDHLKETFDLVLSDVPCTGSGTWARTPEQFYFFETQNIQKFSTLQYTIANNACKKVRSGGHYVYITCSVFKAENEMVVAQLLLNNPALTLIHQELINGIADQADCMFVAVMQAG